MARKKKSNKTTPEQKILNKLGKKWNILCECGEPVNNHFGMEGCNICACLKYTPTMSINLIRGV